MSTFLTQEGYKKLEEELEHLITLRRKEVAERLREAMDGGELVDNGEFEAAKNEQAFVEGRIKELKMLLATSQVIDNSQDAGSVQIGSTVTIRERNRKPEVYHIVGAPEANPATGHISNESPLGVALLGKVVGDKVEIEAPGGSFTVKIIKIE